MAPDTSIPSEEEAEEEIQPGVGYISLLSPSTDQCLITSLPYGITRMGQGSHFFLPKTLELCDRSNGYLEQPQFLHLRSLTLQAHMKIFLRAHPTIKDVVANSGKASGRA